jgi:large subunit ribosomal protein L12
MEYIYAGLLLHKLGQPVSEENLKKIIEATGKPVDEAKVKVLVESLRDMDIDKELETATIAVPASGAPEGEAEGEAKEKKKEEKASESAEGLSALFG